jgi:predicted esterase
VPIVSALHPCNLSGLGFPPVALFHGSHDVSVPSSVSAEMAAVLCRGGGDVSLRMYEEWAHTDAILEGPVQVR